LRVDVWQPEIIDGIPVVSGSGDSLLLLLDGGGATKLFSDFPDDRLKNLLGNMATLVQDLVNLSFSKVLEVVGPLWLGEGPHHLVDK